VVTVGYPLFAATRSHRLLQAAGGASHALTWLTPPPLLAWDPECRIWAGFVCEQGLPLRVLVWPVHALRDQLMCVACVTLCGTCLTPLQSPRCCDPLHGTLYAGVRGFVRAHLSPTHGVHVLSY
jgi:hypothetical protein